MSKASALGFILAMVLAAAGTALPTAIASPTGPMTNSEFEAPPVTRTGEMAVEGSALDDCYGLGHQVQWGSSSPQGQATGGPFGDPAPNQADPAGAVGAVLADPAGTAEGQTECAWNEAQGQDVAFLNPAELTMTPAGWQYDLRNQPVEFGYGFDSDVMDRETLILANSSRSDRNLWQVLGPKHHAFTPNAEALELRIEAGSIPDRAEIQIAFEPRTPTSLANDALRECQLTFDGTQLQDALNASPSNRLSLDPVTGDFDAREDGCNDLETAWNGASDEQRRDLLAQTRLTEVCLWYWNHGTEPVVVDDLQLRGASLVAEEKGQAP